MERLGLSNTAKVRRDAIKQRMIDVEEAHRKDVRVGVRVAVKRVLIRKGVNKEDFDKNIPFVKE